MTFILESHVSLFRRQTGHSRTIWATPTIMLRVTVLQIVSTNCFFSPVNKKNCLQKTHYYFFFKWLLATESGEDGFLKKISRGEVRTMLDKVVSFSQIDPRRATVRRKQEGVFLPKESFAEKWEIEANRFKIGVI